MEKFELDCNMIESVEHYAKWVQKEFKVEVKTTKGYVIFPQITASEKEIDAIVWREMPDEIEYEDVIGITCYEID